MKRLDQLTGSGEAVSEVGHAGDAEGVCEGVEHKRRRVHVASIDVDEAHVTPELLPVFVGADDFDAGSLHNVVGGAQDLFDVSRFMVALLDPRAYGLEGGRMDAPLDHGA